MVVAIQDIAVAFIEARRSGKAITTYPGDRPQNLEQAYEIQDYALSTWNREVGGWKVGKINPPDDAILGVNRLVGPIFTDVIFDIAGRDALKERHSPIEMPVFAGGFAAAEAEFMLRLAPIAEGEPPQTNGEAMEFVDEIRIGIEVASSPYVGINTDGPCVTVSDHGNNAGLVLGPKVDKAAWPNLDQTQVSLSIDGKVVGQATSATMLDGPFGAVRFLLNNLKQRGIEPKAGWWVSSGAITGVHETVKGSEVECFFVGFGSLKIRIA